jgi:hypothetical protein
LLFPLLLLQAKDEDKNPTLIKKTYLYFLLLVWQSKRSLASRSSELASGCKNYKAGLSNSCYLLMTRLLC